MTKTLILILLAVLPTGVQAEVSANPIKRASTSSNVISYEWKLGDVKLILTTEAVYKKNGNYLEFSHINPEIALTAPRTDKQLRYNGVLGDSYIANAGSQSLHGKEGYYYKPHSPYFSGYSRGKSGLGSSFAEALLKLQRPVVTLNIKTYTDLQRDEYFTFKPSYKFPRPHESSKDFYIHGFKASLRDAIDESTKGANYLIKSHNHDVTMRYILLVCACLILIVLIFFICKKVYFKAKAATEELKKAAHERAVRKIAEEEAIRTTVRNTVSESDIKGLEVLKRQIKEAVDKGDTKTAIALTRILSNSGVEGQK